MGDAMSLILEALRKLERDRPRDGSSEAVVLLASQPWPEAEDGRGRRRVLLGAAAGVIVALVATGVWLLWPHPASRPAAADAPRATPAPEPLAAAVDPVTPEPTPEPAPEKGRAEMPVVASPPAASTEPPPWPSPMAAPSSPQGFLLTAIGERDGQRVAMLNDRLVRVGDAIDGNRIVAITDSTVEVELADGRRITVRF